VEHKVENTSDNPRTLLFNSEFDYRSLVQSILQSQHAAEDFALLLRANNADDTFYLALSSNTKHDADQISVRETSDLTECLEQNTPKIHDIVLHAPALTAIAGFENAQSALYLPIDLPSRQVGVFICTSDTPHHFTKTDGGQLRTTQLLLTLTLQNVLLGLQIEKERAIILNIAEDTRKKLARNLHDGPIQNVSAIALQTNYVMRLLQRNPQVVPDELRQIENLARKTIVEIRQLLFTVRPLVLENQGLRVALYQLAEKIQTNYHQPVNMQIQEHIDNLLTEHEQTMIFYIVEEAINNARKHAQAALISVEIGQRNKFIYADIVDNGVGFNKDAVYANYDQRGSLGMVNMRERAELINATLTVETSEGKGTHISLRLPVARESIEES